MSTTNSLIYMANQIARELVNQNRDSAVEATFAHLRRYWDPAMRARIVAYLETGGDDLHDVARAAVRQLGLGDSSSDGSR